MTYCYMAQVKYSHVLELRVLYAEAFLSHKKAEICLTDLYIKFKIDMLYYIF